ncbi:TetR/AcrR family transcriptional regulator [Streptomyces calidiresistens]|nr:TetR/AcrR family transcriptional regulator [Streptomyces calidiresistens]
MARLKADDWAEAALTAIREGGGLAAVAVEPLAARLGATKGSFYWHFTNREALIEAALARWEEQETEAVILLVNEESDPRARVRRIMELTFRAAVDRPDPIEQVLLADAAHPLVAAALHRVAERRLAYLVELFTDLGHSEEEARHRALLAYTTYLGHAQLAHSAPRVLPGGPAAERYLETVLAGLLR